MTSPHRELIEFVLDQADLQPSPKKIRLYRALAEFAGDPKRTRELQDLADTLDRADQLCREFKFRFGETQ